jgi:hypothetical protein
MSMRRFTRLINEARQPHGRDRAAFHALQTTRGRTRRSRTRSLAMAAGIADHVWTMREIAALPRLAVVGADGVDEVGEGVGHGELGGPDGARWMSPKRSGSYRAGRASSCRRSGPDAARRDTCGPPGAESPRGPATGADQIGTAPVRPVYRALAWIPQRIVRRRRSPAGPKVCAREI